MNTFYSNFPKKEQVKIFKNYYKSINPLLSISPEKAVNSIDWVIEIDNSDEKQEYVVDLQDNSFECVSSNNSGCTGNKGVSIISKSVKEKMAENNDYKYAFNNVVLLIDIKKILETFDIIKQKIFGNEGNEEEITKEQKTRYVEACKQTFTVDYFLNFSGIPVLVSNDITPSAFVSVMKHALGLDSESSQKCNLCYIEKWSSLSIPLISKFDKYIDKNMLGHSLANKSNFLTATRLNFVIIAQKYQDEKGNTISDYKKYKKLYNEFSQLLPLKGQSGNSSWTNSDSVVSRANNYNDWKSGSGNTTGGYYGNRCAGKAYGSSGWGYSMSSYGHKSGAMRITTHAERMKEKEGKDKTSTTTNTSNQTEAK